MEVKLDPEMQLRLERIASARGSDPEMLAKEAIERLLDYDEWFIREVEVGLASADSGKLLAHEEVGKRVEKFIAAKQTHL